MSTSVNRIDRIISGRSFPRYTFDDPGKYFEKIEEHASQLKRAGTTHLRINDPSLSIAEIMDPENYYLTFTTYGNSLDKYVTSSYNKGLYHPSILEQNQQQLLWNAQLAKKYGLRCWIRCVEMTFMPESFFIRHPALRGPRVDNPSCSNKPIFALCPEVPEVQDHYRQLITNMLHLAPEIDEMHIFTCDSGGGFCYSNHLYSGPNGPVNCKKVPTGKQAQTFARVILEAARKINPDFRVVMTSGLMPDEREDFLDGAPDGAAASVYGAFAWGGGLEDYWANMAIGPDIHKPEIRAHARKWQEEDMKARIEPIVKNKGKVYVSYTPEYYHGPSDVPVPYQVHEIIMKYLKWGATNIIEGARGLLYHANDGIIRQAMVDGAMDTTAAVKKLAVSWVGEKCADGLCKAWQLCDEADREWPMPGSGGHAFWVQPVLMQGPIVPNDSMVHPDESSYYLTSQLLDEQKMKGHQGGAWRKMNYRDEIKQYITNQLSNHTIPRFTEALSIVDSLLATPGLTSEQSLCLSIQKKEITINNCYMITVCNWFMASLHRIEGSKPYAGIPSLVKIIESEIVNQTNLITIKGENPQTDPRTSAMKNHLHDPVQKVDLHEFDYFEYMGLKGWQGAHEKK